MPQIAALSEALKIANRIAYDASCGAVLSFGTMLSSLV
jgi:hypothetical protein